MQLKNAEQTEQAQIVDRVTAAMETGNHGQARTLMRELRELDEKLYKDIRMDVISEYGIAL